MVFCCHHNSAGGVGGVRVERRVSECAFSTSSGRGQNIFETDGGEDEEETTGLGERHRRPVISKRNSINGTTNPRAKRRKAAKWGRSESSGWDEDSQQQASHNTLAGQN
ncbi:unnamed protein product [Heligmosomoides polygyrus]|uniref:Uncharacterized protein n=1 Tax=Heligmosomoides polygyrus TaxID=6339 RepID=A0A183GK18_HELPZ|nr:unnamed protein product [Heligmosomoides polygyrus]